MPRVLVAEMKPVGITLESTYGTDAGVTRYRLPGHNSTLRFTVNENVKDYIPIGGSPHAVQFYRGRRDLKATLSMQMTEGYDGSSLANCLIGFALGDAPESGGTLTTAGVGGNGKLRSHSTANNLRSFTMEAAYDTSGTDVYYKLTGGMVKSFEVTQKEGNDNPVELSAELIFQDIADQAAAWVAAPTLSTTRSFFDYDLSTTITNPSEAGVTDLDITDFSVKCENVLAVKGVHQGTAARTIGQPQWTKRRVTLQTTNWRTGRQIEDFLADQDPAGATSDWDLVIQWSKSGGAANEFFKATLTDARVTSPWGLDVKMDQESPIVDKYAWMASAHSWDVIA